MRRSGRDWLAPAAVYVLVLGFPLAVLPTVSDPVLPLRLIVLGTGLALGLLAPHTGRLPPAIAIAIAASALVFTIAALVGSTPLLSLLGRFPRYEGLPMILAYAGALAVGARLLGPGAPRLRTHAHHALVAVSLANAAVAVAQLLSAPDSRVTGLLGNSTVLGTFSLVTLAMVGTAIGVTTWWRVAGLAGGVFCLVASASRGAMLGAVVAALALVAVRLASLRRGRWWWAPASAIVLLVLAWLAPGSRARLTGATPFAESTITGRLLLWRETLGLVQAQPFLGVGPSRFVDSIGRFHTAAWAAEVGPYAPPDSPHDVILQVLASTGWLGLACVVSIVAVTALALWRVRPWDGWQAGAVLAGVGVAVSYLTSFTDPVTLTVLMMLVGGAVSGGPGQTTSPRRRRADAATAVLAVGLGLWLGGTSLVAESRFSAGLTAPGDATGALLAASSSRPWDADLVRRIGYTATRLAEEGRADPSAFLAPLTDACLQLPGSVECLQTLADAQDLSGRHQAALDTLDRATPDDPDNVDTLLKRGIALAELRRLPEAIDVFERAAQLRPAAPEPWDDLAQAFDQAGRSTDAAAARATAERLRHR
jgi:O-antigen ligase